IFDNSFIYVQSMCSFPYSEMKKLEDQIIKLSMTNCALLRLSIRNEKDIEYARLLKDKYQREDFVFVADTHFLPELAIKCIKNGFKKVRINPGNMNLNEMKQIAKVAKDYSAVIRIGLNGGSIDEKKDFKKKNYVDQYINLFQNYIEPFERESFSNIILSAKFSDFKLAIKVNKALYERFNYPIHLGVTEAGTIIRSTILHTLFLREMLQKKIGSTVRISITGDSINEIDTANEILKSLGIYKGINIISCPTCGRTWGNLLDYVASFSEKIKPLEYQLLKRGKMPLKPINCAIMGCEVNGPNEAKDADFGASLTKDGAMIFSKGRILEKIKKEDIVDRLIFCIKDEIYKI
ncbi:MAG: flavodoxin-dependent (E)-4-hydroxy-3-methylbut-2-enyl-diphosphate synthase, partial [Exilispira sp.]